MIISVAEARDGAEPVVIATDGSESAEQAAVAGARVAHRLGTKAVLVYVRPPIGPLGEPFYQEKLSEQMAYARAAIDRAQTLVRGSRGLGAVTGALLGSVSSGIIHRSDRPVLVVPKPAGN
jgi:nucleotide-binding universal stress UspA family protein